MSNAKTAFVFVPGAWCPGYYYHKVVEKLISLGYEAQSIDLPSVGKKEATPGLQDDVAHVRSIATTFLDAGKDLILVGNSYGGFVTLESCKTLISSAREAAGKTQGGQLKHIILIASILAQTGKTMADLVGDQVPIPTENPWIEPVPGDAGYRFFCGSLPEEEGMRYGNMVQAQSVKALLEPLTFAAYEEVGCTMVVGGKDLALKPETQFESFEKAIERGKGVEGLRKVVVEGGDHIMMLNTPDDIVRVCMEAAE